MDSVDQLRLWVLNAPPANFWLFLLIASGASLAAFVYAFVFFHRARIIEDTPTSRIRSAAQGYVELAGQGGLMDGTPIVSPLTATQCTWYRYKVEKMGDKHSRIIDSGVSDGLFLLLGETGRCVVDPEGAVVTCRSKQVWYESSYPSRRKTQRSNSLLGRLGGRYRYTEERMHPGESLYAIGMFMSVGGGAESFNTDAEVRDLLKEWKKDNKGLLQRFDANGDGEIDVHEWEAVRKAAYQQVRKEQSRRSVEPPTHVMTKPKHGKRPFLLSVFPQRELVKRYKLKAVASLAGFLLLGSVAVWMATLRLI
jgi:hypothetical protein